MKKTCCHKIAKTKNLRLHIFVFIWILCCTLVSFLHSQTAKLDSLKNILRQRNHDTVKAKTLTALAENASEEEWPVFNQQLLNLCKEKLASGYLSDREKYVFTKYYSFALNNLGYIEEDKGNSIKAMGYYQASIQLLHDLLLQANSVEDKKAYATSLCNLAILNYNQGNVANALVLHEKSLRIKEEIRDEAGISISFNNLALLYISQHEDEKAIELLNKSLAIRKKSGDVKGIATVLINIASVQMDRRSMDEALANYEKSLEYAKEVGDLRVAATALSSMGVGYEYVGNKKKAFDCHMESYRIREKLKDKNGMAYSLSNIGFMFYKSKDLSLAKDYFKKSLVLSREVGFPQTIKEVLKGLYVTQKAQKDFKNALAAYTEYISLQDSINNVSTRKASIKSQLKYEYEKQAAADSVAHAKENEIKSAELSRQSAEIRAKKNQQYALFGGLGLVLIFSGFMFNRFKVTQKQKGIIEQQKEIVEEQKKLVEEKQSEILDSIKYARRIQMAQIPSEKRVGTLIKKLVKN